MLVGISCVDYEGNNSNNNLILSLESYQGIPIALSTRKSTKDHLLSAPVATHTHFRFKYGTP